MSAETRASARFTIWKLNNRVAELFQRFLLPHMDEWGAPPVPPRACRWRATYASGIATCECGVCP